MRIRIILLGLIFLMPIGVFAATERPCTVFGSLCTISGGASSGWVHLFQGVYPDVSHQFYNSNTTSFAGVSFSLPAPRSDFPSFPVATSSWYGVSPTNDSDVSHITDYVRFDSSGYPSDYFTNTRIVSVTPYDHQILSSSVSYPVSVEYFVSDVDYVSGMVVHNNWITGFDAFASADEYSLSIGAGGGFDWMPDTLVFPRQGLYVMHSWITKPFVSVFGYNLGSVTVLATTTQFVVGQATLIDSIATGMSSSTIWMVGSTTSTSTPPLVAYACSLLTFDLFNCLAAVFVPSPQQILSLGLSAKDGFLSAYPWGYVTRAVYIASVQATSTLPMLSISTPPNFPIHATLNADVFGALPTKDGSFFSTATSSDNHTFREVVEPYWNIIVAVSWLVTVIVLITGYELVPSDGDDFPINYSDSDNFDATGNRNRRKANMRRMGIVARAARSRKYGSRGAIIH